MQFLKTDTNEIIETEDQPDEELFKRAEAKGFVPLADVSDVKTGERHTIKRAELKQALDSGKFVIPELYEAKKAEAAAKIPDFGPLGAAAAGFAKSATMGAAPAVGGIREALKGGEYETGRQQYESAQEAAWQQQPVSYGIGYTAGVLPGMAATGMTKMGQVLLGAGAPLVEEATKISEPITAERAQREAMQVAGGAALGGLGAYAQSKLPSAAQKMGEIAERRAVKAIGADVLKPQRKIERMPRGRQAFGRELLESGIVTAGKTVPEMQDKATQLAEASGNAIGSAMQRFDKKIGVPSINRAALLAEIEAIPAEIGKNPAKVALAQRIQSTFVEPMREWSKRGDAATLEEVWEIRSGLDDLAFTPTGLDKPLNKELQKLRRIIENRLTVTAKNAGITPEELAAYDRAKRTYQVSKEAAITTKEKVDRMQSNRAVSLTDYLSGGAGAGAGATIAGPVGGTVGAIMGAMGNKLARERGPQASAAALDSLSRMMKENPDRFQSIIATFVKTGAIELGEE